MLIGGIIVGLLLGLWSGGRLSNLASIRLRWIGLLLAAVIVRFGTEILLNAGVDLAETLRVPLLATGFVLLLTGLWVNRSYPGLGLAWVGILLNGVVIVVNGGFMPIWQVSLEAAGFTPADVDSAIHIVLPGSASDFLVRLLIIGDLIPIPFPIVQNVASLGDLFLTLGLAFFLFAGVVRVPTVLEEQEEAAIRARLAGLAGTTRPSRAPGHPAIAPETGLAPALLDSAALERPLVLGARGTTMGAPALAPLPVTADGGRRLTDAEAYAVASAVAPTTTAPPIAIPRPSPETMARIRRHPYVRLALNGSFSALWAGQLISLFGDRIHQIALAAVVALTTGSAFAVAMVFVAATLPNLLLSPVAGTLVDRWDHKEVLIVSDIVRAALVLLIPIAAVTNVILVYPLVFLVTTISLFFRPARVAILPRLVREDELLSANSALWVGETMADVIGYPLAGLFVLGLGTFVPVAFWLDAATYVGSAALISTIVVRRVPAPVTATAGKAAVGARADAATEAPAAPPPVRGPFMDEMKAGWTFLRGEPALLANTLQATVAQLSVGILIGLTAVFALETFGEGGGWEAIYSFIETSQGVGSLIGGFLVGLIGGRFAKGRMIILGYSTFGLLLTLFALSGEVVPLLGFAFGTGIANMVFLIPSQTLFQERTPPELMGRVVGFRFALVFGAMTIAMAVGGVLAELVGASAVIAVSGLLTMSAGLAGLLVPAVRDV